MQSHILMRYAKRENARYALIWELIVLSELTETKESETFSNWVCNKYLTLERKKESLPLIFLGFIQKGRSNLESEDISSSNLDKLQSICIGGINICGFHCLKNKNWIKHSCIVLFHW